jgi:hypothetical protein
MKTKLILAVALLSTAFYACKKSEILNPTQEKVALSTNLNSSVSATSSDFNAELLSNNVSFSDQTNSVTGYAWTWEVQRINGQTGLSHFNFIDGILCATDEEAGTLREHIVGAYYSQDGGTTWNYVAPTWAEDGSTSGAGNNSNCYEGEVLKIDFGGDDLQIRLIMDEQYEVGVQYGLFKRGKGGPNNTFAECGIIEFAAPACPLEVKCYEWQNETAWGAGSRYVSKGNWATYSSATALANGVTLYAGQTTAVGTATLSGGVLTISLTNGWELVPNTDAVKIQGYSNTPPASNPAPGQFTTYKGSSLTPSVGSSNFYGIHLDVRKSFEVECPE